MYLGKMVRPYTHVLQYSIKNGLVGVLGENHSSWYIVPELKKESIYLKLTARAFYIFVGGFK